MLLAKSERREPRWPICEVGNGRDSPSPLPSPPGRGRSLGSPEDNQRSVSSSRLFHSQERSAKPEADDSSANGSCEWIGLIFGVRLAFSLPQVPPLPAGEG